MRLSYLVFSCDELTVEGALHEGGEERLPQDRLPQLHQLKLDLDYEMQAHILSTGAHMGTISAYLLIGM